MKPKRSKRFQRTKLSKAATKALLQSSSCCLDQQLTEPGGFEVYSLPDGSALILLGDGSGLLWRSRADLLHIRTMPPSHILEKRLLFGREFPQRVPELLKIIPERLGIEERLLDRSVESLEFLDAAARRYGRGKCLRKELFSALTAYLGEVARARLKGEWQMRLAADNKTWEPWIIYCNGQEFCPFVIVYRELYEPGGSISGAALLGESIGFGT